MCNQLHEARYEFRFKDRPDRGQPFNGVFHMATITLKKPVQSLTSVNPLAQLVDAVGSHMADVAKVKKQIKDLQAKLKTLQEDEVRLQTAIDELPIDDEANESIVGERFRAVIGPRGQSRSISDMGLVREMLGDELFMQIAKVNLKDVDDYMTLPQREKVITIERTKRSLKIEKI